MNLLAERLANSFYGKIIQVHSQNGHTANERVPKIGTILESLFRELTTNDLQSNTKLFERMSWVFQQYQVSKHIIDISHQTRKISNDVRHNGLIPNEKDYEAAVESIAQCILFFSDVVIPQEVEAIYNHKIIITPKQTTPVPKKVTVSPPLTIRQQDLINNPSARLPIALCLDVSGSMQIDGRINELNAGVKLFFESLIADEVTRFSVEICIVTFGGTAKQLLDFSNIDRQINEFKNFQLYANGETPMGAAVELSLSLLQNRKQEYKAAGVDYYQPWLVLMTDGQPTDSIDNATIQSTKLVNDRKLSLFPIAIGDGANLVSLGKFSSARQPLKLKGLNFREFFEWLRESAKSTSQSTPGTSVILPPIGWAVV